MILVTIQQPNSIKRVHAYRPQILKFLSKNNLLHHWSLTLDVAFKYLLPIRQRTELPCNHYGKNAKSSHTASLSSDFQVAFGCIYVETITPSTWKTSYLLTHCSATLQRMSYLITPIRTKVDKIFFKDLFQYIFFP